MGQYLSYFLDSNMDLRVKNGNNDDENKDDSTTANERNPSHCSKEDASNALHVSEKNQLSSVPNTIASTSNKDSSSTEIKKSKSHTFICWCFRPSTWQPNTQEWQDAVGLLDEEEAKRVLKYRFANDAKRSLLGRLMIRAMLIEKMGMPPSMIKLSRTKTGKPFVKAYKGFGTIDFNVSHDGDWVILCASSRFFRVGCDVMGIERRPNSDLTSFFKYLRGNFSPSEWGAIERGQGPRVKLTHFMRLWTLKESYVKAVGKGLSLEPKRVCFNASALNDKFCYENDTKTVYEKNAPVRRTLQQFLELRLKSPPSKESKVDSAFLKNLPKVVTSHSVEVDSTPVMVGTAIEGIASNQPSFRFATGVFDRSTLWAFAVGIDPSLVPDGIRAVDILQAQDGCLRTNFEMIKFSRIRKILLPLPLKK
mmetsp:Transcript_13940/g.21070  ORF Transcript_13940/g.21070 Transcript_13940/m.21070 type:complete len:421 (+) Transcript_13940:98-1360(+)